MSKLVELIKYLNPNIKIPEDEESQHNLFRALVNVRVPQATSEEFLKLQDEYLQNLIREKGVVKLEDMEPISENIYLWQGDITNLEVDAIVNAANSQMLGCFIPNHRCIDNAIHTYAGVQLRLECNRLMKEQGNKEETGGAKITSAYNLPSKYVIHTVGPIIYNEVKEEHKELLKSCYEACFKLAVKNNLKSLAFCCISTGEFRFPNKLAAEIAVNTVREYLKINKDLKVVFNVFKNLDLEIYREILK